MNAPADVEVKTFLDHPSQPILRLPAGACDSHVHVWGPPTRFPYAEGRRSTPVEAPKERLFALHQQLGIERCVVVQSIIHGHDNRVVEDTMAAGEGRYLGVALVPPAVSSAELHRLARVGFRAVRFHFMTHIAGGVSVDDVLALTPRLADVGMHLQVHFESGLVHTVGQRLLDSAVPVVIDHMGRVDATQGLAHADFQALKRLLEHHHMWVKVSGIDRINAGCRAGSGYPQGVELAHDLVRTFPTQCVWGLDWPHPNHTHIPDDGELVDALARIAPSPSALQALLVDNPQRLYHFAPTT
jgi:2-pyrone-4,6-dicarboxylate lactonase